jgi:hypothetical protein
MGCKRSPTSLQPTTKQKTSTWTRFSFSPKSDNSTR